MSRVPEFVHCDTCGEIKPEKARWLWLFPMEGPHNEDYCSWSCLAVRCEKSLLPRQPLPYTTIGVVERRTALEEELLEKMTE